MRASASAAASDAWLNCGFRRDPGKRRTSTSVSTWARPRSSTSSSIGRVPCPTVNTVIRRHRRSSFLHLPKRLARSSVRLIPNPWRATYIGTNSRRRSDGNGEHGYGETNSHGRAVPGSRLGGLSDAGNGSRVCGRRGGARRERRVDRRAAAGVPANLPVRPYENGRRPRYFATEQEPVPPRRKALHVA